MRAAMAAKAAAAATGGDPHAHRSLKQSLSVSRIMKRGERATVTCQPGHGSLFLPVYLGFAAFAFTWRDSKLFFMFFLVLCRSLTKATQCYVLLRTTDLIQRIYVFYSFCSSLFLPV